MPNLLNDTPMWFVAFITFTMSGCIVLLGGYFLWSIKTIFADLKNSIKSLETLISRLYDDHSGHESRISVIEGQLLHRRQEDD